MDATIIEAPSSTKSKAGEPDPDMHQTRKGNPWHFELKAHIGADAKSGLTHSFTTTAANEHDLNQAENLLHGGEDFIFADAGYPGAYKQWPALLDHYIQLKTWPRTNISECA